MADVEVVAARLEDRGALENLIQLYVHDFSEHWAGTPNGELQDDGRFAPYPLGGYWEEPERIPLLFRRQGRLIGFALINAHSHAERPLDHAVAEFFVVRKHRRDGVGQTAAHAIFAAYPGRWEAAVARRNTAALAFWRRAVASCPGVSAIEEVDMASEVWNGPVLCFGVAASAASA